MMVGRRLGLSCGHFTPKEEREFTEDNSPLQYCNFVAPQLDNWQEYCEQCNDFKVIKRINAFVIERDIPEVV
jgi:hypothetical protein